jgi:hypothetical protein
MLDEGCIGGCMVNLSPDLLRHRRRCPANDLNRVIDHGHAEGFRLLTRADSGQPPECASQIFAGWEGE